MNAADAVEDWEVVYEPQSDVDTDVCLSPAVGPPGVVPFSPSPELMEVYAGEPVDADFSSEEIVVLVLGAASIRLGNTLLRTHAFEDSKSDQTQAASACAHGRQLKVIIPAQSFDATLGSLQQLAPGGIHAVFLALGSRPAPVETHRAFQVVRCLPPALISRSLIVRLGAAASPQQGVQHVEQDLVRLVEGREMRLTGEKESEGHALEVQQLLDAMDRLGPGPVHLSWVAEALSGSRITGVFPNQERARTGGDTEDTLARLEINTLPEDAAAELDARPLRVVKGEDLLSLHRSLKRAEKRAQMCEEKLVSARRSLQRRELQLQCEAFDAWRLRRVAVLALSTLAFLGLRSVLMQGAVVRTSVGPRGGAGALPSGRYGCCGMDVLELF